MIRVDILNSKVKFGYTRITSNFYEKKTIKEKKTIFLTDVATVVAASHTPSFPPPPSRSLHPLALSPSQASRRLLLTSAAAATRVVKPQEP